MDSVRLGTELRWGLWASAGLQLGLLLWVFAGFPLQATAQALPATVLSIGDGDTIRVRQGGRAVTVRLACIDAPETAQSPYGHQARSTLQQRLPIGREVILHVKTTDRYGRTVAEVISDININLAMVEDGQAFAYRQYLGGCDAKEYLDAEFRASRHRYGVWQVEGGITRPWDFRRGGRSATVIPDGTTPGGRRYRCSEIGSYDRAQELLRQGHSYLDGNGDGEACESLRWQGFWRYGNRHSKGPLPPEKRRTLKLRGGPGATPTLALQQSPARDHPSRCAQRRCANDATHNR